MIEKVRIKFSDQDRMSGQATAGMEGERTQMKGTIWHQDAGKPVGAVGPRASPRRGDYLALDSFFPLSNLLPAKTCLVTNVQRLQSYKSLLAIKATLRDMSKSCHTGQNCGLKTSMRKIQDSQICCMTEYLIFQIPATKQRFQFRSIHCILP